MTVQAHVVGALLMRELHTRFGRDNIGYLWAIFEPGLLALAVTLLHVATSARTGFGLDPIPFWVVGYTPFCMWRFMVLRAEAAIESNRTLLYHRMVTITDLIFARGLLELASVSWPWGSCSGSPGFVAGATSRTGRCSWRRASDNSGFCRSASR